MTSEQLPPIIPSNHVFRFRLNQEKALAAARYLVARLGGAHNYTALLKILFFADRYHVRKYIRPISTDSYVAMPNGPVASFLYDVFKGSYPFIQDFVRDEWDVRLAAIEKPYNELSESDIEALDFALKHFSRFSFGALIDLSHEYPEWSRYSGRFKSEKDGHEPIFIEDFFGQPDPLNKTFKRLKFSDPYPEIAPQEREDLIDDMLDYAASIPASHGA